MKKILMVTMAIGIIVTLFTIEGTLPREENTEPVQVGSYIQVYDDDDLGSPITLATAHDTTLVIPAKAAEFTINPNSGTLKYESYSDTTMFFQFDTIQTFPCSGLDSLRIANDSGSSVTWYFYFNMLQ